MTKQMKKAVSADSDTDKAKKNQHYYLICERKWLYFVLIAVAGFWGAFTYLLRGDVFCNAQTGNVVLMGMALGTGHWMEGLYYLIPISAYMLGAFVSELLPNPIKHRLLVRWDTLLILIEMAVVLGIGFLPESAPVQISQVAINFIASMQYNTFRQAEGIPVATTFATNHIRQIGIGLAKEIRHRHTDEKSHRIKLKMHLKMLFFFAVGCIAGAFLSNHFLGKAIWATLLPLAFVFCVLLYADLVAEKSRIEEKPAGH